MCGIAGVLTAPGRTPPQRVIDAMTDTIHRRGPDARGVFIDREAGVALGHRRLAIVDLTPAGAQPMESTSQRFVMVLNGEIYNFRDVRRDLEHQGVDRWRGTSDTEVLLNAIELWGIETALERCDGMFALALWDRRHRELLLARDRFGEKPLFVAETPDGLAFASQLTSIRCYPSFVGIDDDRAIDQFLALSYIPEPLTPFTNVTKLPAGTFARLTPGDRRVEPQSYWNAADAAVAARRAKPANTTETLERIEGRLKTVIANQMIADVQIGAFLSGGIDSSLVVALMQQASSKPVKTFTIGFEDKSYDESSFAEAVAQHLGTEHTTLMVRWQDALALVDRLPDIYDEPFGDSSQLPTALVSTLARKSVTVALTGDAGDEVFGGYNRHRMAARLGPLHARIPKPLMTMAGGALATLANTTVFDRLERAQQSISGRSMRRIGEKAAKVAGVLKSRDELDLYLGLIRRDDGLLGDVWGSDTTLTALHSRLARAGLDLAEQFMVLDTETYLPGDILTKVDRASMAVALETRVPFLDHRLYEMAWQLPLAARIKDGQTKHVLRTMLARHVPSTLFERPKSGFGVPISAWLKADLKDWIEDHLSAFKRSYPRHADFAARAKAAFQAGSPTAHHVLWNIAMLQLWRSHAPSPPPSPLARAATGLA